MSGNKQQVETLKLRYGNDYFIQLAKKGNAASPSRPFRDVPGLAAAAGRAGKGKAKRRRIKPEE